MRWVLHAAAAWLLLTVLVLPALSWALMAQAQAVAMAAGVQAVAPDPGPPPLGVVAVATLSAWQSQADSWWAAEVRRVTGR